jgi:hypothetical protein
MTKKQETEILEAPSTHKLVHEVLELAATRDCVDAYYDIILAAEILRARMDRLVCS